RLAAHGAIGLSLAQDGRSKSGAAMIDVDQRRFQQELNSCRSLLAAVSTQEAATRLKIFRNVVRNLTRSFIPRGVDKAMLADVLNGWAGAYMADIPVNDRQLIIADEIAEAEQIERVPDEIGEEPQTNGHDESDFERLCREDDEKRKQARANGKHAP